MSNNEKHVKIFYSLVKQAVKLILKNPSIRTLHRDHVGALVASSTHYFNVCETAVFEHSGYATF